MTFIQYHLKQGTREGKGVETMSAKVEGMGKEESGEPCPKGKCLLHLERSGL